MHRRSSFPCVAFCGTGTEEQHVTLSKCASTFNAHVCPLLGQNAEVSFLFEQCMKAIPTHTATDASVQEQWCSDVAPTLLGVLTQTTALKAFFCVVAVALLAFIDFVVCVSCARVFL